MVNAFLFLYPTFIAYFFFFAFPQQLQVAVCRHLYFQHAAKEKRKPSVDDFFFRLDKIFFSK